MNTQLNISHSSDNPESALDGAGQVLACKKVSKFVMSSVSSGTVKSFIVYTSWLICEIIIPAGLI